MLIFLNNQERRLSMKFKCVREYKRGKLVFKKEIIYLMDEIRSDGQNRKFLFQNEVIEIPVEDFDTHFEVSKVLIKISGDLNEDRTVLAFIAKKARNNFVVVICGGGTQINEEIEKGGFSIHFGEHGRVTASLRERQIARDVLEDIQMKLQNRLIGTGAYVEKPVVEFGTVLCHINGDYAVEVAYLGFDEIFVFTLESRKKDKMKRFKDFPKIQVIGV
jgi:hypothetical protein